MEMTNEHRNQAFIHQYHVYIYRRLNFSCENIMFVDSAHIIFICARK